MMADGKLRAVILLGCGILFISSPVPTATAAVPVVAKVLAAIDVDSASARLFAAAEPFEALSKIAYSALGLHLEGTIADAEAAATDARSSLSEEAIALLDVRTAEIHQAYRTDDRAGLATSSVEAYRILVSAAHPAKVPTAVNLMDYAGMRYDADFRANPIRWADMKEAAAYAREQWSSVSDKITDQALKETVDAAVASMELAAAEQNTFKARRSVTAELGHVDDLERYFSKR